MKQPAALDLIQNKPWAITQAKLDEIDAFINMRLRGERLSDDAIEAIQGRSGPTAEESPYEIMENGVAVIPVYGTITKRANIMSRMSGGTSAQLLQRNLKAAFDDPSVSSIVLDIESPGGSVDGTKEAADYLYSMRGKKPVTAYANGVMCSAAYWIGAAADKIYCSPTAEVGSIGVLLTHYDKSGADAAAGIKRTMVTAGSYKRIAGDNAPLTVDGAEYLQTMVDAIYSMFVDDVARFRGVSSDEALSNMANGRIFIGKAAVAAGLVDDIATLTDVIKTTGGIAMNYETLKADHGDLYNQILAEGAAAVDVAAGETAAAEAATAAERGRVAEIMALGGPADITVKAIAEGMSPFDASKEIITAIKAGKATDLAALAEAAPAAVGATVETVSTGPVLSVEEQAKKDFAEKPELRTEFPSEASYVAFAKADALGKAKILKK